MVVRIPFDVDVDVADNGGLKEERLVRALRWPFDVGTTGAAAG